jgi:hypothetical protein
MEFPPEILRIIREYSLPVTCPDWRKSKPIITTYQMFLLAEQKNNYVTSNLYERLFDHILETEWFYMYKTILAYGFDMYKRHYFNKYGVHARNIYYIDGLEEALYLHHQLQFMLKYSVE